MSVETTINIDEMTIVEKIGLMELLWQDISNRPENIEVPKWHLRILEERKRALANGEDEYIDFDVAMAEIRERIDVRQRSK